MDCDGEATLLQVRATTRREAVRTIIFTQHVHDHRSVHCINSESGPYRISMRCDNTFCRWRCILTKSRAKNGDGLFVVDHSKSILQHDLDCITVSIKGKGVAFTPKAVAALPVFLDSMRYNCKTSCKMLGQELFEKTGVRFHKKTVERAVQMHKRHRIQDVEDNSRNIVAVVEAWGRKNPLGRTAVQYEDAEKTRLDMLCVVTDDSIFPACLPMVNFDGSHMKHPTFNWTILFMLVRSKENHNILVSIAIVKTECTATWKFLLQQSAHARWANIILGRSVFMVDRDGGLLKAVEEVCTSGLPRYCIEHIEDNMNNKHLSPKWCHPKHKQVWRAWAGARTRKEADFFARLLQDMKPKQYEYLTALDPKHWLFCEALALGIRTYDVRDNNAAESQCAGFLIDKDFDVKAVRYQGPTECVLAILDLLTENGNKARNLAATILSAPRQYKFVTRALKWFNEQSVQADQYQVNVNGPDQWLVRRVGIKSGAQREVIFNKNAILDKDVWVCKECTSWPDRGVACRHCIAVWRVDVRFTKLLDLTSGTQAGRNIDKEWLARPYVEALALAHVRKPSQQDIDNVIEEGSVPSVSVRAKIPQRGRPRKNRFYRRNEPGYRRGCRRLAEMTGQEPVRPMLCSFCNSPGCSVRNCPLLSQYAVAKGPAAVAQHGAFDEDDEEDESEMEAEEGDANYGRDSADDDEDDEDDESEMEADDVEDPRDSGVDDDDVHSQM